MKKALIYIFLAVFLFQSTANFWILLNFYVNQDYISKNECINRFDKIPICYGKCVLQKELEKSEKQDQKLPNLKVTENQVLFLSSNFSFITIPDIYWQNPQITRWPDYTLIKRAPSSIFHPPNLV